MNFTLFVTALLTGCAFVAIVIILATLLAPRSFNAQKEEPYECGVPTRGRSWMQFRVGYYLFAILFLMFDVETMFLFPWAVVMKSMSAAGLFSVLFVNLPTLGFADSLHDHLLGRQCCHPQETPRRYIHFHNIIQCRTGTDPFRCIQLNLA